MKITKKHTLFAEQVYGDDLGKGKTKTARHRHKHRIKVRLNRLIDLIFPKTTEE